MPRLTEEQKIEKMLYHPALNIPERGMTGRYMPAGVNKDGVPLIEIEFFANFEDSLVRK